MGLLFAALALVALAVAGGGGGGHVYGPNDPPPASVLGRGMPPEIVAIVQTAVTTETVPARLESFAGAIRPYYPEAANVLEARARWLEAHHG